MHGNWLRYKVELTARPESDQGELFSAEDTLLSRPVTIKKISGNVDAATREAALMASYGQNLFLPQVFDFFSFGVDGYIVTDALPPATILGDGKRRELTKAIRITQNILRGLRHLHEKGVLHACLEPRHVLLSEDRSSTVKISGFAHAVKKRVQGYYQGPAPKADWAYMAPEQFEASAGFTPPGAVSGEVQLDDRADLYSAAAICYYLLMGSKPFTTGLDPKAPTAYAECYRRHEQGQVGEWNGVPDDLKFVLIKAMHPDRDSRPANANEFMNQLRPFEK